MKLLIYGINFHPEITGIGKYTSEMAAWLVARGLEVRVVTAPPYYPAWRVGRGYRASRYLVETLSGARVFRTPLWVPLEPRGLKRMVHLASFALSSFPVMLRNGFWRPDVVWTVEPAVFCAPTAWAVARLSGAQAWLHVQDYEVDAAFDLGLLKGNRVRKVVGVCERWLMRRFDRVSTISQRMLERAQLKGVEADRLVLFRNWVDLASAAAPEGENPLRGELGIRSEAVVALYSGNMGNKQGLEILAEAAVRLRDHTELLFVFCGNGSGRGDLVARCDGLPNVRFLDLQPIERLGALLAMADIHLLPQRADAADLVMPSKLTGMLASGRPVVATASPGTELASVVAGRGVLVPPADADAFAGAVLRLADNPAMREELGAQGRQYAETYLDRDAVLSAFEAELTTLLAEGGAPRKEKKCRSGSVV